MADLSRQNLPSSRSGFPGRGQQGAGRPAPCKPTVAGRAFAPRLRTAAPLSSFSCAPGQAIPVPAIQRSPADWKPELEQLARQMDLSQLITKFEALRAHRDLFQSRTGALNTLNLFLVRVLILAANCKRAGIGAQK